MVAKSSGDKGRDNPTAGGDKGTMKIEEFGKNLAEEVSNMINKW